MRDEVTRDKMRVTLIEDKIQETTLLFVQKCRKDIYNAPMRRHESMDGLDSNKGGGQT